MFLTTSQGNNQGILIRVLSMNPVEGSSKSAGIGIKYLVFLYIFFVNSNFFIAVMVLDEVVLLLPSTLFLKELKWNRLLTYSKLSKPCEFKELTWLKHWYVKLV